jgi:predicted nuclease with TOPRIM domain
MAPMSALAAAVALALLAALAARLVRRLRALSDEVEALSERVHELSARLEVAEQDAASALAQADVAESVLLDKGVADEEDLAAARARSAAPAEGPRRDDELH